jgi:hypothetical protein
VGVNAEEAKHIISMFQNTLFENKMLRRIFGPKRVEVMGGEKLV